MDLYHGWFDLKEGVSDAEFAKTTPFRQPIAHGLLVLSLGSGLGLLNPPMRTLAFLQLREWHFREPVFIGDTIHVHSKIVDKEVRGRGRRGVLTWQRQILNQENKVIQEGITLTLVEGRGPARPGPGGQAVAQTEAPREEPGPNEGTADRPTTFGDSLDKL